MCIGSSCRIKSAQLRVRTVWLVIVSAVVEMIRHRKYDYREKDGFIEQIFTVKFIKKLRI